MRAKWFPRLSKEEKRAPLAAGGLLMGAGGMKFLSIPAQVWGDHVPDSPSGFRIDGGHGPGLVGSLPSGGRSSS